MELFIRYIFPKIGQTKLRIPNLNYLRKTTSTSASRLCVGHFALKMGFCCLINNGLVVAAKNVCHPFHNGAQIFDRSYVLSFPSHFRFCWFWPTKLRKKSCLSCLENGGHHKENNATQAMKNKLTKICNEPDIRD